MPDVRLPDGRLIRNVPQGTTKEQLTSKLIESGLLKGDESFLTQQPTAPPAQQPLEQSRDQFQDIREQTTRELGLGARSVLQGISTPVTLLPDLAALGINTAFGTDIQPLSGIVSEGLTTLGLPEPETAGERITGEVIEFGTGGGVLAKGLQQLGTKAPKIIQQLASKPAVEVVAGGAAAGAAGTARELGADPLTQLGLGLAGGVGAGAATSRALRGTGQSRLLEDIAERGIDEPQAFVKVRSGLESEAKKLREKISGKFSKGKKIKPGLFDVAKERGQNAFVDNDQLNSLSSSFKEQAINEIDADVKSILQDTSKLLDNLVQNSTTPKQINELEGLRRSASRIAKSGGSKGFAGGQVLRGIDDFLENAVITGDQEAVGLWKEAIRTRREFGLKFEKSKKIAQAIESDQTLETIEKTFLGSGVVSTQKDLAKTYQETLRAVKPSQRKDIGFAMRQSVLNRIIRTAAQSSDSAEGLSASRLSNSIRNLRRENRSFWNKFSVAEKETLTKLENDLRKVSKGGVINKAFVALEKIISRGLRSNIEVPRTLKAKTIVTVDDLLELSSFRPPATVPISPIAITPQVIEQQQ